jgi:chromosome segregation ATPase
MPAPPAVPKLAAGAQICEHASVSGNGHDLDQVIALLGDVLAGQNDLRTRVGRIEGRMGGLETRMDGLGHRMSNLESDMKGLRQQVTAYHSSVVGHGILISELEARVQRIEAHLNLTD